MNEHSPISDNCHAGLVLSRDHVEQAPVVGFFRATLTRNGEIVWEDEFKNLVVNVGKIDMLDKYFAGSAYTAAFFLGLVDGGTTPTFNAADTAASHAGWTENVSYASATRPAVAWNAATASGGGSGTAGTGSKASTTTAYAINATATLAGVFLTTLSTKSGTTGTLFSAGAFTGGNKAAANGDTLNVTWTGQN